MDYIPRRIGFQTLEKSYIYTCLLKNVQVAEDLFILSCCYMKLVLINLESFWISSIQKLLFIYMNG